VSGLKEVLEKMKRRWDLIHKFENKEKFRVLRKLSPEKGFDIMADLCDFARLLNNDYRKKPNSGKISSLIKAHMKLNKVRL